MLYSTETVRLIRDGRMEVGEEGEGRRKIMYLLLHCHHQKDSSVKMGSDESHFNAPLVVRNKGMRQCPLYNLFEEKGEPKRNRTEALNICVRGTPCVHFSSRW